jgi:hypothetical protein
MEGKRMQITYAYLNSLLHQLIFPLKLLFFNQDSNQLSPENKLYNLTKQFKVNYDNFQIHSGKLNNVKDDSLHT